MALYLSILYLICILSVGANAQSNFPNIIFILADDLGYGDVQCLNAQGKIPTPHINSIASSGLKFTDAHSTSAVCTPTRYSILTGRYAWRTRLKRSVLGPYDTPLIEEGRTTIASMLKKAGYRTAAFGKWHLGFNWSTNNGEKPIDKAGLNNLLYEEKISGGPIDHGFDYFFGVDAPNFPPYAYIENNHLSEIPSHFYSKHPYGDCRPGTGIKEWKLERIMPELKNRAVQYINEAAKIQQPFFLYLPLTAPHTPIAPSDQYIGKSNLNVYADFVMEVDDVVGSILSTLQKNKLTENTLVIFTSDNGCSPQANFNFLKEKEHDPSTGFRGHKADLFEGGHRIPLLIQWPERLPKNKTVQQTVSSVDFMSTCASIVGYELKENEAEDSYNILPLLLKPTTKKPIRDATVHHSFLGEFAIRKGKWKLLLTPGSGGWSFPINPKDLEGLPDVQLYNMENDSAEKNNLEHKHPKIVSDLKALLQQYVAAGKSVNKYSK